MKKLFLLPAVFFFTLNLEAQTYEYKIITSVESIVPSGVGRSRIVEAKEERNYKEFTSERSETDKSRNKSKRKEIRVNNFEETKLLNFFNAGGIRFQNIAANDAVMTSKINAMVEEGWELSFVNAAVEASAGADDGEGIFITRYIFRRLK